MNATLEHQINKSSSSTASWLNESVHIPFRKPEYLFLLSHMRSYSSLLAHILGSSPDIDGYGETQIRYRRKLDLWRLKRAVQRSTGRIAKRRFLLDKVLHNHLRSPYRFIASNRVRALVFLRKPEASIRSLMTLAFHDGEESEYTSADRACEYYVSRLYQLRHDGQALGLRAMYFDAEQLVNSPQAILSSISCWLQLNAPLQMQYQTGKCTGTQGFGDPLPNIRAGHILDNSASTQRYDIELPASILAEANAAYVRCRQSLMENCAATCR